jgi:hypothetical protein
MSDLLLFDEQPFLPTRIGGNNLQLWLDAADASTITESSGSVSAWADKSGNGNNATQGTGSAQPTTGVRTLNGKNALEFDGGDYLSADSLSSIFSGSDKPTTIFLVCSSVDVLTQQYVFLAGNDASVTPLNGALYNGGTAIFGTNRRDDGSTIKSVTSGTVVNYTPNVFAIVNTGTSVDLYFDSSLVVDGGDLDVAAATIDNFTIGASDRGGIVGQYFNGVMGEGIIYDRALSTSEISQVNAYLTSKWLGFRTPTDIAGLQAWYDTTSDDYLTLDGSAITQFLDRSGNGNDSNVQGTASARPTRTASQINGLQAAVFDGGDVLELPSALYSISNDDNTIFLVSQQATDSGNQERVYSMTEGGSGRHYFQYGTAAGTVRWASNTTGAQTIDTGNTNTDFNIIRGFRDGTTQGLSINGATATTDSQGANEPDIDGAVIGAQTTALANPFIGSIAEILIYDRALTSTEIDNIENYLSAKYNIGLA